MERFKNANRHKKVKKKRAKRICKEEPLVSVVMATYNDKPKYLRQSLDSIRNQTYKNIEVIVLDDSADQKTIDALGDYRSDHRIHIYHSDKRLGFVRSLNKGLDFAKGKYIARMDGDDVAELDRFTKQVQYLNTHSGTDILGGQINIIDEDGNITGSRTYPLGGLKLLAFFMMRSPVAHSAIMFRRSIVDLGYRYDERMKQAEDIDFWIRLHNAGYRINNLPDTVLNFRVKSDFMNKRLTDKTQEKYVIFSRKRNFTRKKLFFSIADWIMADIRHFAPDFLKEKVYRDENGK